MLELCNITVMTEAICGVSFSWFCDVLYIENSWVIFVNAEYLNMHRVYNTE